MRVTTAQATLICDQMHTGEATYRIAWIRRMTVVSGGVIA